MMSLVGKRYGRLVVLKQAPEYVSPKGYKKKQVECLCDCGIGKVVGEASLKRGLTKSCGCLQREILSTRNHKHGNCDHPLWGTYSAMINRCTNEKSSVYKYYGGRGISVCEEWLDSFDLFVSDMGDKPDDTYSIDRIDNYSGYSRLNCKWSSKTEQIENRRLSHNNKSGHAGIFFREKSLKWESYSKRYKYLGSFKTIDEAIKARGEYEKNIVQRS